MPKDGLRRLPDHVTAALLRALMTLPAPRRAQLILQRVAEDRGPFWNAETDYDVLWRGKRVGRIDCEPNPYPHEQHVPWRWFLDDAKGMAHGRAATREEAMTAFRKA